jgi:hypothetical protein
MPGIFGITSEKELHGEEERTLAAMARPLIFTPEQEVELFRHEWYCAGTVGYEKSFSFLKKASARKGGVLLIMDGEVFPDVCDVPHELATPAPTIQRAEYCLYLYLQYGPQFVQRLNGTFVIAVFDNRDRMVHLYIDRFGSEPVYIWSAKEEFAFATSLRSLLRYRDDIGRKYDSDALAELVVFERVLGEKTVFGDIRRLVPASHAMWDGRQLKIGKYWEMRASAKPSVPRTWKDAAAELHERLRQDISKRTADGAQAGALVSGGIDSRLLLACCPSSTIAATFSNRNHPPSVETRLAGKMAKVLGHEHVLIEREADHYATVAELAVDVIESEMVFAGCHSLGLHQQMLDAGIQVVITGNWFDTYFKGMYAAGKMAEDTYRDEPNILQRRRIARNLADTQIIRRLRHLDLMMLALSNDMKDRAAVAKERAIRTLMVSGSDTRNLQECSERFTLLDLQSCTPIGFARGLRTCFPDRSPTYNNDLLAFGLNIPIEWKKDGRIVRRALRLANPRLAWISDANTGLPAGLCPPWNRVLGHMRQATRNAARRLSRISKTISSYRQPPSGCKIFTQESWHDRDGTLRLCERYRSMVEATIEKLDGTIFDKSMIVELFRDDLSVTAPRLHKLFEIILTFGMFDKKWGPHASRNALSGEIQNMRVVDLRAEGLS